MLKEALHGVPKMQIAIITEEIAISCVNIIITICMYVYMYNVEL